MILFDLLCSQPFGSDRYHGGGEYTKAVFLKYIETYGNLNGEIFACLNTNKEIDSLISRAISDNNVHFFHVDDVEAIYALLEKESSTNKVIHFFTGLAYSYYRKKFPVNVVSIGTCHGLRDIEKLDDKIHYHYLTRKDKLQRHLWMRLRSGKYIKLLKSRFATLFDNFDYVITVSGHTYYSIKVNFPNRFSQSKLLMFYTPAKEFAVDKADITDTGSYIMMISANRWLKNAYNGVLAIDHLYSKGYLKDVRTRVYGNLPKMIANKLQNRNMFDLYGYVDSCDLEAGFKNCSLLLYPTLNEGFGLPPFEAMKYGKTCVVSAVCSLTEVYGNAVYYCNPYDVMEIENRILHAVESKIPVDLVLNRVNSIKNIQTSHTLELCKLIHNGSTNE